MAALSLSAVLSLSVAVTLTRSAAAAVAAMAMGLTRPVAGIALPLAAETSGLPGCVALRARCTAPATRGAMPVAIGIVPAATAARLTDREVRILPFRRLSLRTRQRRANEPAVYGTILLATFTGTQ